MVSESAVVLSRVVSGSADVGNALCTHISQASTTEAFGTTEPSFTEEYTEKDTTLEPTSADPDTTIETYLHVNLHALWIHLMGCFFTGCFFSCCVI